MIRDQAKALKLDGADRKDAINFICSQQYLYWVNIAKMKAERSWHIENYMAIVLTGLWEDAYFQSRLSDPLRGDPVEIAGVVENPRQNLGPYMIESDEQYTLFVREFKVFLAAVKKDRERRLQEKHGER